MILPTLAQLFPVLFIWVFFWLPGRWLSQRLDEADPRGIRIPSWFLLPLGLPNKKSAVDFWGLISQIMAYWISITLLLELMGIVPRPLVTLSLLVMGIILVPVGILLELSIRNK